MVVAFRSPALGVCLFVVHLATLASSVHDVSSATPLEKVVALLKKLSVQLTEEGKVEAAQYDKYACFCKEQADEKLYAVETSDKKIKLMKAEIDEMSKEIVALNGEISDLTKKIGNLENDIKVATGKREGEVKVYQGHSKDIKDAISACERAIEAMKSSKGDIDGKVDLAQISASSPLLAASLLSARVKQAPPSYEYSSNDIIATLESLLIKFKANKVDLDTSEFNARSAFEFKEQAMQNQKKFAEKEKSEKESQVESLMESVAETTQDKDEETKAMNADNDFIKVLTTECETKAKDWDQRSQTRADEITAITKALTELEEKAIGNYKVNKKLVGIQMKQQVKFASYPAPSFLQMRRSPAKASLLARASNANRFQATQRVLDLLLSKTKTSQSSVLASITMKITMLQQGVQDAGVDHFVKVRTLIKDLVAKLEADAKSEANTKSYCDQNMKKQVDLRDAAKLTIEDKAGAIKSKESEKASIKQDIAALQEGIAQNKKELLEAQELRAEEKARNDESLKMSDEGKKAVDFALTVLKDFYDNAFLQNYTSYVAPNSDRSGNTVGDLAPKETFKGEYHGNTDASKGILGILQVIAADFARTTKQVEADEKLSKSSFDDLVKDNEANTKQKEKELTTKNKKLSDVEDEIVNLVDDKKAAEKDLESAQATLEDLRKMCIAGEETYEERVAKREEEIEALKSALEILENWKS